jgi:RecA/RadA recombinase
MAAVAIKNAQRAGHRCVLFDSENATDTAFMASLGVNVDELIYITLLDVEMFFEVMEELLELDERLFVVWDSVANTKARGEEDKSYEPTSSIALKARTISKGFAKIFSKLIEKQPTILICNQLKRNLDQMTAMTEPWVTPGGEAIRYVSSLSINLTTRKAKAHRVLGPGEQQIGSEVKAKIVKSRFGSLNRECAFKIIWNGPEKGIMDEESWFDAIQASEHFVSKGAWYALYMTQEHSDDKSIKFTRKDFVDLAKNNPEFRERVLWVIQDELVNSFQQKANSAEGAHFYNVDESGDDSEDE